MKKPLTLKILLLSLCNLFLITRGSFIEVPVASSPQDSPVSANPIAYEQPQFPFNDGKASRYSNHNYDYFGSQGSHRYPYDFRHNRRFHHLNSKFMSIGSSHTDSPGQTNGNVHHSHVHEETDEPVFILSSAHKSSHANHHSHPNHQSHHQVPITTTPGYSTTSENYPNLHDKPSDFPATMSSSSGLGDRQEFEIRLKSALSVSLPASVITSKKSSTRLDILSSRLNSHNESSLSSPSLSSSSPSSGEPELITESSSLLPFPSHVPASLLLKTTVLTTTRKPVITSKFEEDVHPTVTPLPQNVTTLTKPSVSSSVPYPPLPNLPSLQYTKRISNLSANFTHNSSPNASSYSSSQYYFPPPRSSSEKKGKGHHPGGLITAIALILANSLAQNQGNPNVMSPNSLSNYLNDTTRRHYPLMTFNGTKTDEMMASDSNIITSSATNVASWLRNMISGSKAWMRKQRQPEFGNRNTLASQSYQLIPQFSQNHGSQAAPPTHPGVSNSQPFNIIPAPDGFPGPYNGESVLLPPEALQDTGIMYWLNFIEQAAQQSQQDPSNEGLHQYHPVHVPDGDQRPIMIGEKPSKTGPNSIRDELIMDDGETTEEEGDPFERSRKVVGKLTSNKGSDESASEHQSDATAPRCDKFTASICVDDFEYPEQAIVDEIYKRREIFELMYSDDTPKSGSSDSSLVDGIPKDVEEGYVYETDDTQKDSSEAASSMTTLKDGLHSTSASGYVCPSEVLYGRPKLAKSVAGEWKVIVNAGEFTQTLRMEKCLRPNSRCSFILPHLETRCAQVHSVHRLMVFEKGRGFFVESFKIPTGCNCQIIRSSSGSLGLHDSSSSSSTHSASSTLEQLLLNPPAQHIPQQQTQPSQQNQLMTHNSINSLLNSNRNRYKNQQQPQLSQQALLTSLQNLQRNQQQMLHQISSSSNGPQLTPEQLAMGIYQRQNTVMNNQHQQQPLGVDRGLLTNALWSLLMSNQGQDGGQSQQSLPSDETINAQLNLLQFLKQNNPQLQSQSQANAEALLTQLINDHSRRRPPSQSKVRVKISPNLNHEPPMNNHAARPHQLLPATTTIVNPMDINAMAGGGHPLVQVIHVPVAANPGSYPASLFKSSPGHPPLLTAYDSHSSATIFVNNSTASSNVTNDIANKDRISYGEDERHGNNNNTSSMEYLSPEKDMMYTQEPFSPASPSRSDSLPKVSSTHVNNSMIVDEEEDTEEDEVVDPSEEEKPETVKDEHQGSPSKTVFVKTERGKSSQEGSIRDNNNSVTKRMLSQKMNFNYHPILDYIPISSQSSHQDDYHSSLASEATVKSTRNE